MTDYCGNSGAIPDLGGNSDRRTTQLRLHEAVCAERYANLLSLLESTTRRVGRLEVLIVIVAGSVIGG